MIYPTEMSIATGTTVYAGDPDSDERIASREVRVSVTFQIDEEDIDLADLAHEKMAEVERARVAALEKIAALERIERDCRDPDEAPFDPGDPALEPPDEQEEADAEADRPGFRCGPSPTAFPGPNEHTQNGGSAGFTASRPAPPWTPTAGAGHASEAETDWSTRPQQLSIQSHFRRLGVSAQDQTALLRERFGKFRLERLTKGEAAGLMRSLERGEIEPERGECRPTPAQSTPATSAMTK